MFLWIFFFYLKRPVLAMYVCIASVRYSFMSAYSNISKFKIKRKKNVQHIPPKSPLSLKQSISMLISVYRRSKCYYRVAVINAVMLPTTFPACDSILTCLRPFLSPPETRRHSCSLCVYSVDQNKGLPRPPEKGSVASCLISVQFSPPAGSLAGGCTSLNAFGSSWPSSQKEKGNWSFENTSLLNGNWFTLPACGWISKFQSNAILFPFSAANSSNLKFHLHFLWT